MNTTTKDFGSVRFDGQTILLTDDANYSDEYTTDGTVGWSAPGVIAGDRHVEVFWLHPGDIEDPDDMDWDNVDRIEERENPHDYDPMEVVGKQIEGGQAHWIATYALHVDRGGWTGPQTIRELIDLHDEMLDVDPVVIVEEFARRGKADKNVNYNQSPVIHHDGRMGVPQSEPAAEWLGENVKFGRELTQGECKIVSAYAGWVLRNDLEHDEIALMLEDASGTVMHVYAESPFKTSAG